MIETVTRRPTAAATRGAASVPTARRLSPQLRRLVLAAHVLVGVGWFGVVLAKLVLEVTAVTTRDPEVTRAAFQLLTSLDRVTFPPLAVATLLTGVVLSVGTAWGLFQHYWIVAKLVLTVAVVATGVSFVGAWTRQAIAASSGPVADAVTGAPFGSAPTLLIGAAVVHLLMLGAATVISVYKPWGRIRPDRHAATRRGTPTGAVQAR
jgi:hypothetical protein